MIELTLEYRKRKLNKYAIQTVVLSFQLRTHFQISFLLLIILEHLFHGDSFSVCVCIGIVLKFVVVRAAVKLKLAPPQMS